MHMYYVFGSHIDTFSSVTFMYSLVGRHISFSFMPINFNIIHKYVPICSTNAY